MYRITTLSQHHKNKHVLSANTSTKAWIRFNEVRKIRYAMLPVSFELANMFMFEKLFLQKLQILIASMKWFVIDVNDPENFIACNRLEMNHFLMNFIVIHSRHNILYPVLKHTYSDYLLLIVFWCLKEDSKESVFAKY